MNSPVLRRKKRHIETASESGIPVSVAGFKQSDKYILESQLTPYDYIPSHVTAKGLFQGGEPFYDRTEIVHLFSVAQWRNKFNRSIREGEKPQRVISRDIAGVQRTIELYSEPQTEPWKNVIASSEHGIPTNDYGNVEMDRIPENAVLIPCPDMGLAMRVCKGMRDMPWCRCQSGWKRKSPVYAGIVVLVADYERVQEALNAENLRQVDEEERAKHGATMSLWRLLIRRMQAEWYIKSVIDR
jgi:hypothetical protein